MRKASSHRDAASTTCAEKTAQQLPPRSLRRASVHRAWDILSVSGKRRDGWIGEGDTTPSIRPPLRALSAAAQGGDVSIAGARSLRNMLAQVGVKKQFSAAPSIAAISAITTHAHAIGSATAITSPSRISASAMEGHGG